MIDEAKAREEWERVEYAQGQRERSDEVAALLAHSPASGIEVGARLAIPAGRAWRALLALEAMGRATQFGDIHGLAGAWALVKPAERAQDEGEG